MTNTVYVATTPYPLATKQPTHSNHVMGIYTK